jgi:hypothetical protein
VRKRHSRHSADMVRLMDGSGPVKMRPPPKEKNTIKNRQPQISRYLSHCCFPHRYRELPSGRKDIIGSWGPLPLLRQPELIKKKLQPPTQSHRILEACERISHFG